MIIAYVRDGKIVPQVITQANISLIKHAVWLDLLSLTKEEEGWVENELGFEIPTREEMREIEISSRLYKEDDHLFMTATMIVNAETDSPKHDAVTFIINKNQFITLRYIDPRVFKIFATQLNKISSTNPLSLLSELLDITVDRLADILEVVGQRLDDFSRNIFHPQLLEPNHEKVNYYSLMQQIGLNGNLNTRARESLVTLHRLITFFSQNISMQNAEYESRLASLIKDIAALSDHANFLSTKISFLLDATLGMVSIEQNNIIKIFSVAAVIFLPPTLIASIYGMNFHSMPELSWKWGYLLAITMMMFSSWLPYKYFKKRKWL